MSKEYQSIQKKGRAIDLCASLDEKYICCNFHVLRAVFSCPFSCTYCFLQNYLNDKTIRIVDDIEGLYNDCLNYCTKKPEKVFRIGTWELGDSLAFEQETQQARKLIKAFKSIPNAILDFRTKSDCVDSLLDIPDKSKVTLSWTMNPQSVIEKEEHETAALSCRLKAMKKATDSGFLTTIHFDPMIYYGNWKSDYYDLVKSIFTTISNEKIAWVSIGSLRFNPGMKKTIERDFPNTSITSAEMVTGNDGKMRYVKPIRVEMYKHLVSSIRKFGNPDIFVHLCMERWDVWEKVFGSYPKSTEELDETLTISLQRRGFI